MYNNCANSIILCKKYVIKKLRKMPVIAVIIN